MKTCLFLLEGSAYCAASILPPNPADPALEIVMKPRPRPPGPAAIVAAVVETLLDEGADLKTVTLDEFKDRMTQTIRRMTEASKATAA